MHIAVDLDDVVMDFWTDLVASINLEYGTDLSPADTIDWDDNSVKNLEVFGEGRTWWDWLEERDWIWHTFKPVPGAIGSLEILRQQGHYLEAITAKPRWAEWTVWKWLGKWRPPFNRVTLARPTDIKAQLTNASVIIDDRDKNITEWVTHQTPFTQYPRAGILFERPWSNPEAFNKAANVAVARNWSDVMKLVKGMEDGVW
jgi:hypothetical protein